MGASEGWNISHKIGHDKCSTSYSLYSLMPIIVQGPLSKMGSALVEFLVLAGITTAHFVIVLRKGLSGGDH
jgi:hypothetical protein